MPGDDSVVSATLSFLLALVFTCTVMASQWTELLAECLFVEFRFNSFTYLGDCNSQLCDYFLSAEI